MKPTCFMLKVTKVGTTEPQTNHSQYSSPVKALNLIIESKSHPVELDNSTIELHRQLQKRERTGKEYGCLFEKKIIK